MNRVFLFRLMLPALAFIHVWIGASGQQEAANWCFGDQLGIHFGETGVSTLSGCQAQYNEGVSAMSDCKGNLLFYTDGVTVWNKLHQPMVNGTGLMGHYSATQGSIIIPYPGHCNQYYIFTLDGKEHAFVNGMRYSVVDMNLQNGLGEVVVRDVFLYSLATEKMAAVKHLNKKDFWVVSRSYSDDAFYAWLLTDIGVAATPVISHAGIPITNSADGIGAMKISPQGDKLALVTLVSKYTEVFDFDAGTGVVSNPLLLGSSLFDVYGGLYGVEFSPNGKKLYVSNHDIDYLNKSGNLYQFSLDAGSAAAIINSRIVVGNNKPPTDLRGLQLGIDGKIYVSRSLGVHLGVIEEPDKSGIACHYIDSGFPTSGNVCGWSLPSFVASYFEPGLPAQLKAAFTVDLPVCRDSVIQFSNQSQIQSAASYFWDFGDSTTSTDSNPFHVYAKKGNYQVMLIVEQECCKDTMIQEIIVDECFYAAYLPNAFTPNNDGKNETLQVAGSGISDINWKVFDRWGKMVFSTGNPDEGWDGTHDGSNCQQGVYAYSLEVSFKNGKKQQQTGTVTLIR